MDLEDRRDPDLPPLDETKAQHEARNRIDMSWTGTHDVCLDEPWLLMRWDPEHQCVFAEWRAFATSAEFRGALMKALVIGQEHRAFGFVSDTRKLELATTIHGGYGTPGLLWR
jgi:hypothetical protein